MSISQSEIVLGVTGGIAAYKAAALASLLVQRGAGVTAVLTRNARRFVGEPTFAALTGRPVAVKSFDPRTFPLGAHIELAARADLVVVAPASADFLAKLAAGAADDLLTTLALCAECPLVLAHIDEFGDVGQACSAAERRSCRGRRGPRDSSRQRLALLPHGGCGADGRTGRDRGGDRNRPRRRRAVALTSGEDPTRWHAFC